MPKPSLAEALAGQQPRYGGPSCRVCDLLPTLPDEDAKALRTAFEDRRYTGTMIVNALKDYGEDVSISTVRRHRRRECSSQRS
jgi:hypothetical protein